MTDPANQAYPAHPRVASTQPDFVPVPTDAGRLRNQSQLATSVTQSGQLLRQHLVA